MHRYHLNRREGPSNIFGMPVFHDDRIYVAGGGDIWWGKNEAWFKCIDATLTGDVTATARRWSYPLVRHVMSTPAVAEGWCSSAIAARRSIAWTPGPASPIGPTRQAARSGPRRCVADGKVYLGTRRGQFLVFAAARRSRCSAPSSSVRPISATAVAANGTLYVATMNRLFAVGQP